VLSRPSSKWYGITTYSWHMGTTKVIPWSQVS
jgi:hypothetical protein